MKREEKWNNYVALSSFFYFVLSYNLFNNELNPFFSDGIIIKFFFTKFSKKKNPRDRSDNLRFPM